MVDLVTTAENPTVKRRYKDMPAGQDGKTYSAEVIAVAPDNYEYETVAASVASPGQALGATGAVGDYLKSLILVVATAATATVSIKDGADAAIVVFPNSPGGGIGTYTIPIGLKSRTGAWQVITGAGVSVIAVGDFT